MAGESFLSSAQKKEGSDVMELYMGVQPLLEVLSWVSGGGWSGAGRPDSVRVCAYQHPLEEAGGSQI